jgi:hypothetical protein
MPMRGRDSISEIKDNNMMETKKSNQTFGEIWHSLTPSEQSRRANEIMERLGVSMWTIQSWITDPEKGGYRRPSKRRQAILAEMFQVPVEGLFLAKTYSPEN